MKITKEEIKKLKPCSDGYKWFIEHGSSDLTKTLLAVNKVKPDWASWLYTRLMTPKQQKQFAIYAAEQVLHIFEEKYPDDDRPRLAIVAAKIALESNTQANREAARRAAYAAYNATYDAVAASNAVAAADAAYGAGAAYAAGAGAADAAGAYGAYAAAIAAYANAANAAGAAGTAMREKLIRKAVKILQ